MSLAGVAAPGAGSSFVDSIELSEPLIVMKIAADITSWRDCEITLARIDP
jgi:hypothetical protein